MEIKEGQFNNLYKEKSQDKKLEDEKDEDNSLVAKSEIIGDKEEEKLSEDKEIIDIPKEDIKEMKVKKALERTKEMLKNMPFTFTKAMENNIVNKGGDIIYRTTGSVFGFKGAVDWGLYLAKKGLNKAGIKNLPQEDLPQGDVYKYFSEKDIEKSLIGMTDMAIKMKQNIGGKEKEANTEEQEKFQESKKEMAGAYKEFKKRIREASIPAERKKELRLELTNIMKEHKKSEMELHKNQSEKFDQAMRKYTGNKITGFALGKDALNSALSFAGFSVFRGIGYGMFAALDRGKRAMNKFSRNSFKNGEKWEDAEKFSGKKFKHAIKDTFITSTGETCRELMYGRTEKLTKEQKQEAKHKNKEEKKEIKKMKEEGVGFLRRDLHKTIKRAPKHLKRAAAVGIILRGLGIGGIAAQAAIEDGEVWEKPVEEFLSRLKNIDTTSNLIAIKGGLGEVGSMIKENMFGRNFDRIKGIFDGEKWFHRIDNMKNLFSPKEEERAPIIQRFKIDEKQSMQAKGDETGVLQPKAKDTTVRNSKVDAEIAKDKTEGTDITEAAIVEAEKIYKFTDKIGNGIELKFGDKVSLDNFGRAHTFKGIDKDGNIILDDKHFDPKDFVIVKIIDKNIVADSDSGNIEAAEIIDTYEEAGNYVAGLNEEYNICETGKKIEDFTQDEMLKLLIASKTEGKEKQWGEIKNFLEARMDEIESAKSGASYKFALEAEQSLGGFNEDDITKVIGLCKDLKLEKGEIIKLFPTKSQGKVSGLLNESGYKLEGNGNADLADDAAGAAPKSEAEKPLGLEANFSLELGKGKVPAQLERVFSMIAADLMKDVLGDANADGVKMFDEEEGAKILNVAANLVRLSDGKDTAGIKVESLKDILSWDESSQKLEIKDYQSFNKLVEGLHSHADKLWTDGVLQKGATEHLGNIKNDTWQKIIRAEGLEKVGEIETGIEGHDDIKANQIVDFKNSAMVQEAEKLAEAAQAKEAAKASAATEQLEEKSPQDLEIEKNRTGSIRKVLEIFDKKGLANIDEVYRIAEVNPDDGLSAEEIGRIKILAEHQDILKDLARISENKREDVFQLILDEKISKYVLLKIDPRTAELLTEINLSKAIENIPIDETVLKIDAIMNRGKMVEKDILLFWKVLAGDEAVKNMNILLGGAGVKNVVFDTENSRIAAELFNGKNVNFYIDGRENSIVVRTPFLKSKTLFEGIKPFKTDLSKDGLDAAREKLGVEINTAAEMEILEEVEKIKWVKKKKVL